MPNGQQQVENKIKNLLKNLPADEWENIKRALNSFLAMDDAVIEPWIELPSKISKHLLDLCTIVEQINKLKQQQA